jgi:Xaa-Pro aminopeptidase
MPSAYRRRQKLLRAKLASLDAGAFVTLSQPNLLYLCGFTGSSGALLLDSRGATLITDGRYTQQARKEARGARVIISQESLAREVAAVISRLGIGRVAVEAQRLTLAQFTSLQKGCPAQTEWRPTEGLVEAIRAVKEPAEIRCLREAAKLGSEVFRRALPLIVPGITENELAAEIEHRMRRLGASRPAFETIVAFGPRTAWPHARPTSRKLRRNELVLLDMGVILGNYCCDLTRTVFVGRAPARVRRMYQEVLKAQGVAIRAIRAGASGAAVDQAARRVLRKAGLERYFTHSTGHGIGLEVHEPPRLAKGPQNHSGQGQNEPLQAGQVVTVEPGVYIAGLGGVRIEDDVLVTKSGGELLTDASREFLEL